MAKNLGEELQNRQKTELQKFKEQGFFCDLKLKKIFFLRVERQTMGKRNGNS